MSDHNQAVRLGPETAENIAILGSAPSSTMLAPFEDPSWSIWACSPACFAQVASKRVDVWFELHRWMPYRPGMSTEAGAKPWFSPEYSQYLAGLPTVFFSEPQPAIPGAQVFPYQDLIKQYGRYHFTSTVAWMLAYALNCSPKRIALYGIDMAATEEYAYQRPGCQHFIGLAASMGIEVILPPESDLMQPPTMYGIGEHNRRFIKLEARMRELQANRAQAQQTLAQAQLTLNQIDGAIATMNYVMGHWTDDNDPSLDEAVSFSGMYAKQVPAPAPAEAGTLRIIPARPKVVPPPPEVETGAEQAEAKVEGSDIPAFLRKDLN